MLCNELRIIRTNRLSDYAQVLDFYELNATFRLESTFTSRIHYS